MSDNGSGLILVTLDYPEWLGSTTSASAGVWDINDSANTTWRSFFSHNPTYYVEGGINDSVVFDDNATGTRALPLGKRAHFQHMAPTLKSDTLRRRRHGGKRL